MYQCSGCWMYYWMYLNLYLCIWMSIIIFEIYLHFCRFLRLTVVQVFELIVMQVADTLVKTFRQTIPSEIGRSRDHSAGYPIGFGLLPSFSFVVPWRGGLPGCSYCGLKSSGKLSFGVALSERPLCGLSNRLQLYTFCWFCGSFLDWVAQSVLAERVMACYYYLFICVCLVLIFVQVLIFTI